MLPRLPRFSVEGVLIALLLGLVIWQTVQIHGFKVPLPIIGSVGVTGLVEQRDNAKRRLDDLVKQSKPRQAETKRKVEEANERIVYVDRIAREVETAPLPGRCRTPDAVLQADL